MVGYSALVGRGGVANGQVKVELNRKTVQHQEGGNRPRDTGARRRTSARGQPLVVVGDVRSDSELSLLQGSTPRGAYPQRRAEAEAALQSAFAAPADLAGRRTLPSTWHASTRSSLRAAHVGRADRRDRKADS
jgi:hypothetical protein